MRAGIVVVFATVLAVLLPTAAMSLNQAAYPERNAPDPGAALGKADLSVAWSEPEIVQYETASFSATLIYDAGGDDPGLPTIDVAYNNSASLTAEDPAAFTITATSPSQMALDTGTARPEGGFELTWTWDVTPREIGPQNLVVHFIPEAFVNGVKLDLDDRNAPVEVSVKVHPAQVEFTEAVAAAENMTTTVPDDMTVGTDYDVSASFTLVAGTDVSADIDLAEGPDSVDLTIREVEVAALASALSGVDTEVSRQWVVTPNAAGQVSLVFTALLNGKAGTQPLEETAQRTTGARAAAPPPPVWDVIGGPVTAIGSIIGVISAGIALWLTLRKLMSRKSADDEESGEEAEGKSKTGATAGRAKDAQP